MEGRCFVIGIIGRALIVRAQQVADILDRDPALGHKGPGQVVAFGGEIRVGAIPAIGALQQIPGHKPGSGRVVDMVAVASGAKSQAGIEAIAKTRVEVVSLHKVF